MRPFDKLKEKILRDFLELRYLEELRSPTHPACIAKEREIGQHSYEAEEALNPSELRLLKRQLGMSEDQWRSYKATFIAGSSPGEQV